MNKIIKIGILASAFYLLIQVIPASAGQSNATLSGPVLGYVFHASEGTLRPLRGVAGNATVGDPVPFDFAISQALTLDARHFVISTDASPELLAISMESNPASVAAIRNAPSSPTRAIGSVHGNAAAFYYAGSQRMVIVTGPPGNPVVSQSVDLSALNPAAVTHAAVSDDGGLLVYSVAETDRESLYVWTPSIASSRFVFSVTAVGDIAIAGSGAAFVTDRDANEVFAIWDPRNTAVSQYLLGERDGVSKPAAIAISKDNSIYIANTGSATVMTLDISGHLQRTLQCDCRISGLYPLRDSVFLLTDRLDHTIYLLATSLAGDRVSFVPALKTNP